MCKSFEERQIEKFLEEYDGTAIGESIARKYENGSPVDDIYIEIEDFGY